MEIAHRLEQRGLIGKVFLIDSGIQLLHSVAVNMVPPGTPNADEIVKVILLRQVCINALGRTLSPEIENAPTWDEKVNMVAGYGSANFSASFVRLTVDVMVNTMSIASKLDPTSLNKIKSDIVLVRPVEPIVRDVDEDYQMSQYTTGSFTMHILEGDHTTVMHNAQLLDLINQASPYKNK